MGTLLVLNPGTSLSQVGPKKREVYDVEAAMMVSDGSAHDGAADSRQVPGN